MNLTNQVRSIAEVTKAVAGGDLTKKIEVDVRGEILDLKETVNGMTESLSVFADEVTRVAREVGTEGRLGGQARVTNVGGTWKDLTDNVNVMAANVMFISHSSIVIHSGLWLTVDSASAYDCCCHSTSSFLPHFAYNNNCFVDCGRSGRSHPKDNRCPCVGRNVELGQHHQ